MRTPTSTFHDALVTWQSAAIETAKAKAAAERAYAEALLSAEGKNAEARDAEALLKSHDARLSAELAGIETRAAYHAMMHLRGQPPSATETEPDHDGPC
jgi:hypothetical protein